MVESYSNVPAPIRTEFKELSDQVETLNGKLSKQKSTLTSGVMVTYNAHTATVFFNGYSATNDTSFDLPEVCRPWQIVRFLFMDTDSSSVKCGLINTNGNILLRSLSGSIINSANVTATVTYITNE